MPARPAATDPSIQLARGRAGFEQIEPAWAALASAAPTLRFFQHPSWYRAMFEAGLVDAEEFVFVTRHAGGAAPAAVLPLQRGLSHVLGLPVRTLGLVDHPHVSLNAGLFADAATLDHWMPQLVQALHQQRELPWDLLRLDKVPERCLSTLPPDCSAQGASAYIDTRDEEAAFGPVSNSFKRELRRRTRKAEEVATLTHEVHQDPATLDAAITRWLAVEAASWKGAEGTAIQQDPRLVAFYRTLAREFGARGECVVFILRHGEHDVAAQFGLRVQRTLNLLKIGYHEAHAAYAPGNLIMERTLRWCCMQPQVDELSFVTNPPWGHLWKPRHERVVALRQFNPTPKGRLLQWALRAKHWHERRRAGRALPLAPAVAEAPGDGVLAG